MVMRHLLARPVIPRNRYITALLYKALCVALIVLFVAQLGVSWATNTSRTFLPTVTNGAATVCDGSAPLLDQDTGDLSAMRDADGRYIVAYQDRAHGDLAHIAEHVGNHLTDLA